MPWWDPVVSDEERAALARELLNDRPDADLENLLMGELAGPASTDRPDLPVWEYGSYVSNHPAVALSDLTRVRFPVLFFEGTPTVTSIDEELKPFPRNYKGAIPGLRYVVDATAILRRYEMAYEAGLHEWDHNARGIVRLHPIESWRALTQAWVQTLEPARHL